MTIIPTDYPLPSASILHVATRYLNGGSERRVVDAVAATPELDHTVLVGCDHDAHRLARDLPNSTVIVEPRLKRVLAVRDDARAFRGIHREIRKRNPALVHTHQSKAGVLGRLAAASQRIPVVHSLSGANFGPSFGRLPSAVFRTVERALRDVTDEYACVGEDLRTRFLNLGVPPQKLTIIRSSIDLAAFANEASTSALPDRTFRRDNGVVAYVGRFEQGKGVSDLAPLLRHVKDISGAVPSLLLAGDGPLRAEVVSACRLNGGDVVDFGFTQRVPEILAASDVVVLLSPAEGLPQILVQALATRRPFVAYLADGVKELAARPGAGSCRAVEIGDLPGAAASVAELIESKPRPEVELTEWLPIQVSCAYRALYRRLLR